MMKVIFKNTLLLIMTSLLCNTIFAKSKSKVKKPNVIYIITDEHNFRTIGAYREQLSYDEAHKWGKQVVETPNLDFLAHNGALFTSMYATTPSCAPSRAAMFTGNYPQTSKVPRNELTLPQTIPTLADVLKKSNYSTGYIGKWHLSGEGKPQWNPDYGYGFDYKKFMFNRGHWKKFGFDQSGNPKVATKGKNGLPNSSLANADEKTFSTDWLMDRAIGFFNDKKNEDKPFFAVISLPDPHTPNTVRAPYDTMYKIEDVKIPDTWIGVKNKNNPQWANPQSHYLINKENSKKKKKKKKKNSNNSVEKSKQKLKKDVTQYFGMVKCIDDNIGKMLNVLKKNNQLDNTIIIFSSDHGDMLGEYGRDNKGVPQEASAKIPFIVYYPNTIKSGTIINKAANNTDFMDTVISLVGGVKGFNYSSTEGRDLSPWLSSKFKVNENLEDLTFVRGTNFVGVFTDQYKLVFEKNGTHPWLIDLKEDPKEKINFIDSKKHQMIVKNLANKLKNYAIDHKDNTYLKTEIKDQVEKYL